MLFNQLERSLLPYVTYDMSEDDFVSKKSRIRSRSRNDSDARPKLCYKGRRSSRSHPQKAVSTHRSHKEALRSATFATPHVSFSPALQMPTIGQNHERISSAAANFQTFLGERGHNAISTRHNLRTLWSASHEPHITRDTLSELDFQNLHPCLYLRHDLNFDRDIRFAPRSASTTGDMDKQMEAQQYWDAVEIELALYIAYLEDLSLNLRSGSPLDTRCSLPKPSSLRQVPQRLKGMIQAICRIMKTLVPPTKWAVLNTRLSPTLFIQQLEHGQCDIESQFCWVGELLLESCAPSRDGTIVAMIETIRQGSRNKDSYMLRRGLQDLFSILETMKLDTANYQLLLLRDFMLSSSVVDERRQISSRLEDGWEVSNWLDLPNSFSKSHFATFVTKFISLVVEPGFLLPAALALDHARIYKLQKTFRHLTVRASCIYTLVSLLHLLGWSGPAPAPSTDYVASLIVAIEQDNATIDATEQREALILGIANHAHELCGRKGLPSSELLCHAKDMLHTLTEPSASTCSSSAVSRMVQASLSVPLTTLVDQEMEFVSGWNAIQLANRYTSTSTSTTISTSTKPAMNATSSSSPEPLSLDATAAQPSIETTLEGMARKMTHIAILHWNVWAPILYLRNDKDA